MPQNKASLKNTALFLYELKTTLPRSHPLLPKYQLLQISLVAEWFPCSYFRIAFTPLPSPKNSPLENLEHASGQLQ